MTREQLAAAYAAPGRHYHNLAHIEDCLAALARVDGLSPAEREILSEAIWWHDVVYDPTRSDNEERSGELAEQNVRAELRQEVGRLIRLTKTHDVAAGDRLGAILISIDLSILGADPAHYDAYAAAIRREFIHVSEPDYRTGRARVLRHLPHARSSSPIPASPPPSTARPAPTSRASWRRWVEAAASSGGA